MSKQLVRLRNRLSRNKKKVVYFLDYIDECCNRQRISLGHSNKRRAEKQRAEKEYELRNNVVSPESMKLSKFTEDSLKRTGTQIRESTKEEYESAMENFISTIGDIDYQKVILDHGEKYRQACLDKGNAPATVTKKLKHLKRLFQLAVKRKQLDENPFHYIDMPKVGKKKIRVYSDAECQRTVKVSHECCQELNLQFCPQWDLMIVVGLTTGMRRAELLNCTWSDIDFEEQVVNITAKESTQSTWRWDIKDTDERTLPLTEDVAQLLADHQAKQPEGYPYVFVPVSRYDYIQKLRAQGKWKYSDARLKVVNNFTRQFEKILLRAKVRKGQFHDIRRTAITHWFANGMSENDVMILAGHANFATTHKFYLAVADDLVDRARKASANGLVQNLAHIWHAPAQNKATKKADNCNQLTANDL